MGYFNTFSDLIGNTVDDISKVLKPGGGTGMFTPFADILGEDPTNTGLPGNLAGIPGGLPGLNTKEDKRHQAGIVSDVASQLGQFAGGALNIAQYNPVLLPAKIISKLGIADAEKNATKDNMAETARKKAIYETMDVGNWLPKVTQDIASQAKEQHTNALAASPGGNPLTDALASTAADLIAQTAEFSAVPVGGIGNKIAGAIESKIAGLAAKPGAISIISGLEDLTPRAVKTISQFAGHGVSGGIQGAAITKMTNPDASAAEVLSGAGIGGVVSGLHATPEAKAATQAMWNSILKRAGDVTREQLRIAVGAGQKVSPADIKNASALLDAHLADTHPELKIKYPENFWKEGIPKDPNSYKGEDVAFDYVPSKNVVKQFNIEDNSGNSLWPLKAGDKEFVSKDRDGNVTARLAVEPADGGGFNVKMIDSKSKVRGATVGLLQHAAEVMGGQLQDPGPMSPSGLKFAELSMKRGGGASILSDRAIQSINEQGVNPDFLNKEGTSSAFNEPDPTGASSVLPADIKTTTNPADLPQHQSLSEAGVTYTHEELAKAMADPYSVMRSKAWNLADSIENSRNNMEKDNYFAQVADQAKTYEEFQAMADKVSRQPPGPGSSSDPIDPVEILSTPIESLIASKKAESAASSVYKPGVEAIWYTKALSKAGYVLRDALSKFRSSFSAKNFSGNTDFGKAARSFSEAGAKSVLKIPKRVAEARRAFENYQYTTRQYNDTLVSTIQKSAKDQGIDPDGYVSQVISLWKDNRTSEIQDPNIQQALADIREKMGPLAESLSNSYPDKRLIISKSADMYLARAYEAQQDPTYLARKILNDPAAWDNAKKLIVEHNPGVENPANWAQQFADKFGAIPNPGHSQAVPLMSKSELKSRQGFFGERMASLVDTEIENKIANARSRKGTTGNAAIDEMPGQGLKVTLDRSTLENSHDYEATFNSMIQPMLESGDDYQVSAATRMKEHWDRLTQQQPKMDSFVKNRIVTEEEDMPQALRAFFGESNDLKKVLQLTQARMAHDAITATMWKDIVDDGLLNGTISEESANVTGHTYLINPPTGLPPGYEKYRTTQELSTALNSVGVDPARTKAAAFFGLIKLGKVVQPIGFARNLISAHIATVAAGHAEGFANHTTYAKALYATGKLLFAEDTANPIGRRLIDLAQKIDPKNYADDNLVETAIHYGFREGGIGEQLRSVRGMSLDPTNVPNVDKVTKGVGDAISSAGDTYSIADVLSKMIGFQVELKNQARMNGGVIDHALLLKTTDRVNNMYQTNSRVAPIVKVLDANPITGAFVGFQGEMVRNVANIARYGATDMVQSAARLVTGKATVSQELQKGQMLNGARTLASFVGVSLMGNYIKKLAEDEIGMNSEKERAFRETIAQPGNENMTPYFVRIKGSQVSYIDSSNQLQFDTANRLVNASILRPGNAAAKLYMTGKELQETFLPPGIPMQAAKIALSGHQFNQDWSEGRKASGLSGVASSLAPGIAPMAGRLMEGMKVPGFVNEDPYNTRVINMPFELLADTTGIKIITIDVQKAFAGRIKSYVHDKDALIKDVQKKIVTIPFSDVQGRAAIMNDAEAQWRSIYTEAQKHTQNMKTWGLSGHEIVDTMKNGGVKQELGGLYGNKYIGFNQYFGMSNSEAKEKERLAKFKSAQSVQNSQPTQSWFH